MIPDVNLTIETVSVSVPDASLTINSVPVSGSEYPMLKEKRKNIERNACTLAVIALNELDKQQS
jgi:hypothetical protein